MVMRETVYEIQIISNRNTYCFNESMITRFVLHCIGTVLGSGHRPSRAPGFLLIVVFHMLFGRFWVNISFNQFNQCIQCGRDYRCRPSACMRLDIDTRCRGDQCGAPAYTTSTCSGQSISASLCHRNSMAPQYSWPVVNDNIDVVDHWLSEIYQWKMFSTKLFMIEYQKWKCNVNWPDRANSKVITWNSLTPTRVWRPGATANPKSSTSGTSYVWCKNTYQSNNNDIYNIHWGVGLNVITVPTKCWPKSYYVQQNWSRMCYPK